MDPPDVFVDPVGGVLAGAHGQDDGGGAGDCVAACKDSDLLGMGHVVRVDAALAGGGQAGGGGTDQGVGAGADGDDDGVHVHDPLFFLLGDGGAASAGVRIAQLLGHALQPDHMAVLITQDGAGIVEQIELDALSLGMLHLFLAGGHLIPAAAIDNVYLAGAQTLGHAGRVHGHVAGAHNGDLVEALDGGVIVVPVGLHQVGAGEQLVGGIDAHQVLAGDVQELGQACAGANEDGLVALLKELVDGDGLAHNDIVLDLHAQGLQILDLSSHDLLGQTELGDAVDQHAAGLVEGLKNGYVIAHFAHVAGAGQAGRAGADHRHLVAVAGRNDGSRLVLFGHVVIRHKALQATDGHALSPDAADAAGLALPLLGADAAADGGQRVGGGDDLIGGVKVALSDLGDEFGDTHAHRAAGAAHGFLAVQAALGLGNGGLRVIAQCDLIKVRGAHHGVLLRHGVLEELFLHDDIRQDPLQVGQTLLQLRQVDLAVLVDADHFLHETGLILRDLGAYGLILVQFSHFSFLPLCGKYAWQPRPARPCRRRRA